ncbi:MAG TPA: SET domain-containing protein-lysine N-methyltransferase [Candidatus Paceibacterota bacterium]
MDPDSLYIKETKCGKGVFTGRSFKKSELLFYCDGEVKNFDEVNSGNCDEGHCIQTAKDKYILALEDGFLYFINHSCNPNSAYKVENGKAIFIALKDIRNGEELVFDYSTSMNEDRWELDCACGSPNCRGRIRDFKYLPENLKKFYLDSEAVPEFVPEI